MADYTLKCDLNIDGVTVGNKHRSINEVVSGIVMQGLDEAGIQYEKSEIEKFVSENCFVRFEHSNIPFSLLLR